MRLACVLLIVISTTCTTALAQPDAFPRPESLQPAIEFWTRVYTEADTKSGYLHDNLHLDVVYEKLVFPADASSRQRRRITDAARKQYREILQRLSRGNHDKLSPEQRRVLDLWPDDVSNNELAAAAERLRFQLGQADRFKAGLERSGRWKPHIEAVLSERGLPLELAALPHVESSFDPTAYSRVGAAGLWQFTRSTGLRYMQIDHMIDERRDPFMSTYAAARLLEDNHSVIQSWPLAITAYNHGLAGMRRAANRLDTRDIGKIVAEYDGRSFGFASRNFYAAFVAALEIDRNPNRYFGDINIASADDYVLVEVPDFITADTLASATGLRIGELQQLNPALMETIWAGDKFVPKGFSLRLPASLSADARAALSAIPSDQRYANQRPDLYHRVARGDTLSQIAQRYGVGLSALVRANGLRTSNLIRIGQVLTLPVASTEIPATLAANASPNQMPDTYTVRRGDSIDRISRRIGVPADVLLSANAIRDANRIFAGQQLRIPGSDPQLADNPEPAADTLPTSSVANENLAVAALFTPLPAAESNLASFNTDAEQDDLTLPVTADDSAEETSLALIQQSANLPAQAAQADEAPDLSADPSDYSVGEDNMIEVQELETLGHYADWLGVRTQRLREINDLSFGRPVIVGQRIKLDFSNANISAFEQRRQAFQQQVQEQFFANYHIEDVTEHVISPGESLWLLAQRRYNVPVWLLRQYNPDVNFDRINPGMVLKFPTLRRIETDDA